MTSSTARAKASTGDHDPRFPHHVRLTQEELHTRAVDRRDTRRALDNIVSQRRKASFIGDKARRAERRSQRRSAYLAGLAKPQPAKYRNASAWREAAPMLMAA